jgi:hypothetical protein
VTCLGPRSPLAVRNATSPALHWECHQNAGRGILLRRRQLSAGFSGVKALAVIAACGGALTSCNRSSSQDAPPVPSSPAVRATSSAGPTAPPQATPTSASHYLKGSSARTPALARLILGWGDDCLQHQPGPGRTCYGRWSSARPIDAATLAAMTATCRRYPLAHPLPTTPEILLAPTAVTLRCTQGKETVIIPDALNWAWQIVLPAAGRHFADAACTTASAAKGTCLALMGKDPGSLRLTVGPYDRSGIAAVTLTVTTANVAVALRQTSPVEGGRNNTFVPSMADQAVMLRLLKAVGSTVAVPVVSADSEGQPVAPKLTQDSAYGCRVPEDPALIPAC